MVFCISLSNKQFKIDYENHHYCIGNCSANVTTLGTTEITTSSLVSTGTATAVSTSRRSTPTAISSGTSRGTTTKVDTSSGRTSITTSAFTPTTGPSQFNWRLAIYIGAPVAGVAALTAAGVGAFFLVKLYKKKNVVQPADIPLS